MRIWYKKNREKILKKEKERWKSYYKEKTNTYEFIENGNLIDIVIDFELDINSNIRAWDIKAKDISAWDINANKISFTAVCFAYKTFVCNAIKGTRKNSKYFCLDSEIVISNKK